MGTRSLTVFQEGDGTEIVVLYGQWDGSPAHHGKNLCAFLAPFKLTNGIGGNMKAGEFANGMGCLAAQVVARFKDGIGSFYLYPAGTRDAGEEYTYIVKGDGALNNPRPVNVTIIENGRDKAPETLFEGTAAAALDYCNEA